MPTLVKQSLHSSVAEAIFKELGTRVSRYYYFLGKPTGDDSILPKVPVDSFMVELEARSDIVLMREIKPADSCLVVKRIDWKSGEVYDKFDELRECDLIIY